MPSAVLLAAVAFNQNKDTDCRSVVRSWRIQKPSMLSEMSFVGTATK